MEILHSVEQNTEEWLKQRNRVIGGSDVPIIMGQSKYKTTHKLWEQKLGLAPRDEDNYIFRKGHIFEDKARAIYELTFDVDIPPKVVKKDDPKFPWAQVSLDGLNLERALAVEIKYVGESPFEDVLLRNIIPANHYPQLQYQMFVTGFEEMEYIAYSEKRNAIAVTKISADKEYIAGMVLKCEEFWWELENKVMPVLCDRDFKKVVPAKIRRTIESLRQLLEVQYPKFNRFRWDGLYMEIKNGKEES